MAKRKRKNIDENLALAFFVVPPLALIGFIVFALTYRSPAQKANSEAVDRAFGGS